MERECQFCRGPLARRQEKFCSHACRQNATNARQQFDADLPARCSGCGADPLPGKRWCGDCAPGGKVRRARTMAEVEHEAWAREVEGESRSEIEARNERIRLSRAAQRNAQHLVAGPVDGSQIQSEQRECDSGQQREDERGAA